MESEGSILGGPGCAVQAEQAALEWGQSRMTSFWACVCVLRGILSKEGVVL